MSNSSPLYCVTGPTASGKNDWAIALAQERGAEFGNADAFQFYREIPILSNQPEKEKDRWHYVGHRSLFEPTTAGAFAREAEKDLYQNWIWVGTGLYLGALLYGLDETSKKGTPFQGKSKRDFRMIVLNPDRELLYKRIDRRVDEMIERGAFIEAEKVQEEILSRACSLEFPPLKAIGLRQLLDHFRGEISREEAIRLWRQETRRLAKRQWTWLRKFCPPSENVLWVDPSLQFDGRAI